VILREALLLAAAGILGVDRDADRRTRGAD
jgi:hypothetical protein